MNYIVKTGDKHWITDNREHISKEDKVIGIFDSYEEARIKILAMDVEVSTRWEFPGFISVDNGGIEIVWEVDLT